MKKQELCGYNCRREWDAEGGEEGFPDCVSAYHVSKPAPQPADTSPTPSEAENLEARFNSFQFNEKTLDKLKKAVNPPSNQKDILELLAPEIAIWKNLGTVGIKRLLDKVEMQAKRKGWLIGWDENHKIYNDNYGEKKLNEARHELLERLEKCVGEIKGIKDTMFSPYHEYIRKSEVLELLAQEKDKQNDDTFAS